MHHPTRTPPTPTSSRFTARLRHHVKWWSAAALLVGLAACAKGDVGAPCNHGDTEPPESKLVTFPALSCNELLCVYADEDEAPPDPCQPGDDAACNEDNPALNRFQCVTEEGATTGECQLRISYVLERSMCSKKCSSDSDCKDGGPTKKVVVENTKCQSGFSCARIQTLGKFCCEKLCVCNDDLDLSTAAEIQTECAASTQEGCCDQDPVPEACGKP
jgi:hypothetical protein